MEHGPGSMRLEGKQGVFFGWIVVRPSSQWEMFLWATEGAEPSGFL
jgi:hypothetical protein